MLRPVYIEPEMIDRPLPWNIYAANGVLVAPAGLVITDEQQFFALTQRPLFRKGEGSVEDENPLRRIDELGLLAESVLAVPDKEALLEVVEGFLGAYEADPDACLGYTLRVGLARPSVQHCIYAMLVAVTLARHLNFGDAELVDLAGAALTMNIAALDLHDMLHGHRGPPSPVESRELRAHPIASAEVLAGLGMPDAWVANVRQHHENADGSGYPESLPANEIGRGARILRVADVYCAQVTGRYYRPPRSPRFALQDIFGAERMRLDGMVLNVLLRRMGTYPPGTLVRLANYERACVARRVRDGQVRRAVSFIDARGKALDPPQERDVTKRATAISGFVEAEPLWSKINWQAVWGY